MQQQAQQPQQPQPTFAQLQEKIIYSDKYFDDKYEYRHVTLPKELAKLVPKDRFLSEMEWRKVGIQMSKGWVHYGAHAPEPHILLFKRLVTKGPTPRVQQEIYLKTLESQYKPQQANVPQQQQTLTTQQQAQLLFQ